MILQHTKTRPKNIYYTDGSVLNVCIQHDMYIARLYKNKENSANVEYIWKYEAKTLITVMKWVESVKIEPLSYKFYESGIYFLPHNNGFGNLSGKREVSKN